MADIHLTLRREKASHLTIDEVDSNFASLRDAIIAEETARLSFSGNIDVSVDAKLLAEKNAREAADQTLDNKYQAICNTLDGKINIESQARAGLQSTLDTNYYTKSQSDAKYLTKDELSFDKDIQFEVNPDIPVLNYGITWTNGNDTAELRYRSFGDDAYPDGMGKSNLAVVTGNDRHEGFGLWDGVGGTDDEVFYVNRNLLRYKKNKIWHEGNDGHLSGLDADTLDGQHATVFATKTGVEALSNKTFDTLNEKVFTIVDGTSVSISPTNGPIQVWTLGASRSPTFANFNSGDSITLMIDDGTNYSITWPAGIVTWKTNSGTAPTLNKTGYTAIVLWKVGTTVFGARVGDA